MLQSCTRAGYRLYIFVYKSYFYFIKSSFESCYGKRKLEFDLTGELKKVGLKAL